jgi:hypothetical protein
MTLVAILGVSGSCERLQINDSWKTIVKTLSSHMRMTVNVKSDSKPTLEKRITSDPELWHLRIYNALSLYHKVCKNTKKISL